MAMVKRFLFLFLPMLLTACHAGQWVERRACEAFVTSGSASASCIIGDPQLPFISASRNAHALMLPASTMKLIPYLVALKSLGGETQYATQIYGEKENDTVRNLTLKMVGDPTLTRQSFQALFKHLRTQGVKRIQGNIRVDTQAIMLPPYAPGVVLQDIDFCFGAPLSAATLDANQVRAKLWPGSDHTSKLETDADWFAPYIINAIRTADTCHDHEAPSLTYQGHRPYLKGCIAADAKPLSLCFPLRDPIHWIHQAIKEVVQGQHIIWKGKVIEKSVAHQSDALLAEHISPPLKAMLTTMLKESDNSIANWVFAMILAKEFPNTRDWEQGGKDMQSLVKRYYGVDLSTASMIDGAGVSRYNSLSATQIFELLKAAYRDETIRAEMIKQLPTNGEGTLKNRLHPNSLSNRLYAKTGSLRDSSSLAGFIQGTKERIFVLLRNHTPYSERSTMKAKEDEVLQTLYTHAR